MDSSVPLNLRLKWSPRNLRPVWRTKIELYLSHGSKSVWVVYPKKRVVRVFDASWRREEISSTTSHSSIPTVLPGFSIPTSAIFEGV